MNSNIQNPLLPVIDIGNNLTTCISFLCAVEAAALPTVITGNPQYQGLATAYSDWQVTVWEQLYLGLLNGGVVAQVQELNSLLADGVDQQSVLQSVLTPSGSVVPTVISLATDMANQVMAGELYVQQLIQIAQSIHGGDETKLAQFQALVASLEAQFDSLEDQLTQKALDNSAVAVVTVIKVGIALATEEDPIEPLLDGVVQVAKDIVGELTLSQEINQTLTQLEGAWTEMDEITQQIAQLNLILNRLNAVVNGSSPTMTALAALSNDWQQVNDVMLCPAGEWTSTGLPQVREWAAEMVRISFPAPVTQVVQPST